MKYPFNIIIIIFLYTLASHGQQVPCAIGAFMAITPRAEGDRLQIVEVISNSPAAQAGLVGGQVVSAIDGVSTTGLQISDCVRRIQGYAGTKVVLEIEDLRHNWTNTIVVTRNYVAGDLLAASPDAFDAPVSEQRLALSVTTNQLVRVWSKNGAISIIQFTQFGTTNANYRWRSLPNVSGVATAGAGVVFEDYFKYIDADGRVQLINRGNPDDLFVKAGGIRLEWSVGNTNHGWLYYYPAKEKVEVLDSSAFNSDFN
jgi:membrane-associated protease RseP (regulator of RpoE activity)